MSVASARSQKSAVSFRSVRSDASRASTAGRSQLHWQKFRSEVLLPHHIRVLPSIVGESIPESIVAYISINKSNTERFAEQRHSFQNQVSMGKGFRASAYFPPEVLPDLEGVPLLTRCMVPSYSPEALPERMASKAQSRSDLTAPKPGLGLGFSVYAFSAEEHERLPRHLLSTGTALNIDTSACSSGAAICAPFMNFERVFSGTEYGMDLASNQCAVDGSWSVRALQMLYAAAVGEDVKSQFETPISFSCCIDNDIAVINYHWVDHAQTYCMAPVLRFDLAIEDDFDQLLLWIEAIGQWAISHLLPEIKRALSLMSQISSRNTTPEKASGSERIGKPLLPLKTAYDYTQWQLQDTTFTPSVSSTASWGSPIVNDSTFSNLNSPRISRTRSVCSEPNATRVHFPPTPIIVRKSSLRAQVGPSTINAINPGDLPAQPAYEKNTNLVMKKRLGHAMDEIEEIQAQMEELRYNLTGTVSALQTELAGMRKAMTSLVRKEKSTTTTKQRSPLQLKAPTALLLAESSKDIQRNMKPVVTTPTEFRPVPFHHRVPSRTPSGLSNVLTPLDTTVSAVIAIRSPKSADSNTSPKSADSMTSPRSAESYNSSHVTVIPRTPLNVPSPSIAPSDAISCISCTGCLKAAIQAKKAVRSPNSKLLKAARDYKNQTGLTMILIQILLLFCAADYLVLLVARLSSTAVIGQVTTVVRTLSQSVERSAFTL